MTRVRSSRSASGCLTTRTTWGRRRPAVSDVSLPRATHLFRSHLRTARGPGGAVSPGRWAAAAARGGRAAGVLLSRPARAERGPIAATRCDGLAAQYADQVAANVTNIESAEISRTTLTHTGQEIGVTSRSIATHTQDLDRDTRRIIRSVREGVGTDYLAYRRRKDADADPRDVRVDVAALLAIKDVLAELDNTAATWVQDQLTKFAVDIKNTTGATRDAYMKVQEQTSQLERVGIELPAKRGRPGRGHRWQPVPDLRAPPLRRCRRHVPSQAQRLGVHGRRHRAR